jgi:DNA (cytosine-5)-methyltransferase 1
MIYASVCSGIEAASVAFLPLGWRCAFVAETEPYCCALLKHYYPETPNYGDITKFKKWPRPRRPIDLLIGGTPCQSFSVAGLRGGMDDPRGNLALAFLGIVDRFRPRWVCWENVPGVHSSWSDVQAHPASEKSRRDIEAAVRNVVATGLEPGSGFGAECFEEVDQSNDFDYFLSGLEKLGYGVGTRIFDAQFFNLAQRRERVFVIGHSGGLWQYPAAVLSERACLSGHPAPRRETRERIAPTIAARTRGGGGLGTDFDCDGVYSLAKSLRAQPNSSHREDSQTFVAGAVSAKWSKGTGGPSGDECYNLVADTINSPGSGGRTTQVDSLNYIPIQSVNMKREKKQNGIGIGHPGDPSFTLTGRDQHAVAATITKNYATHYGRTAGNNGGVAENQLIPVVAGTLNSNKRAAGSATSQDAHSGQLIAFSAKDRGADAGNNISPTLRVGGHKTSHANSGSHVAIAFQPRIARNGRGNSGDKVNALNAQSGHTGKGDSAPCVAFDLAQITSKANRNRAEDGLPQPTLCDGSQPHVAGQYMVRRLLPVETEKLQGFPPGYTAIPYRGKIAADGNRYRAVGNSFPVPVISWIGKRLEQLDRLTRKPKRNNSIDNAHRRAR